jgi:histidyl-tRNA synthetase
MGIDAKETPDIYLVNLGEEAEKKSLNLSERLRAEGLKVVLNSGGSSFKSQMKRADKSGALYAVILGEDEIKQGIAQVKSMRHENIQSAVKLEDLAAFILKKSS